MMCLSTSGNSPNLLNAMDRAKQLGMICLTLLGNGGGQAVAKGDINLVVPSGNTQRIQELHLHIIHLLCTIVERQLAYDSVGRQLSGTSSLVDAVDLSMSLNGQAKHGYTKQKSGVFG